VSRQDATDPRDAAKKKDELKVYLIILSALVTLPAFYLRLKGSLALYDAVVLVGLFAWYAWRVAQMHYVEPDLVGPAAQIEQLPQALRRIVTVGLCLFSAWQSLFALAVMVNLLISWRGALGLLVLFAIQFFVPGTHVIISIVYLAAAFLLLARDRKFILPLLQKGLFSRKILKPMEES
jgi:hypothetical protein